MTARELLAEVAEVKYGAGEASLVLEMLAARVEKVLALVKRPSKNEGPYEIVSCRTIERILNGEK